MFCYLISGLSVVCDMELPGLIPLEQSSRGPDVTIRRGAVPITLEDAAESGPNWQMADSRFVIAVPGIVRMAVSDGATIVYQPDDDAAPEDSAIFISGTGFGILLHQRGRVVLHASAVSVNGHAVLFCGPSGAGKSTLAAAMIDAGHDLVTDDFCAVSIDADGVPRVQPDGRQLKLWRNAIDRLALDDRRAAPVRLKLEKFYVEPRATTAAALPIGAVYMLREERTSLVPRIVQPNIVDGALMLRSNAYRPAMVRRMDQQQPYFEAAAAICRRAGVFTLNRRFDFARLPDVTGCLEAHWRELRLLEQAA